MVFSVHLFLTEAQLPIFNYVGNCYCLLRRVVVSVQEEASGFDNCVLVCTVSGVILSSQLKPCLLYTSRCV